MEVPPSVATVAKRHAVARRIGAPGIARDEMMDIELIPRCPLVALAAGPFVSF